MRPTDIKDIISYAKTAKAHGKQVKRIKPNFAYIAGLGYITGKPAIDKIFKELDNG